MGKIKSDPNLICSQSRWRHILHSFATAELLGAHKNHRILRTAETFHGMEDHNFRQEPYIVDEFKTHFNFPYLALEDKVSGYV